MGGDRTGVDLHPAVNAELRGVVLAVGRSPLVAGEGASDPDLEEVHGTTIERRLEKSTNDRVPVLWWVNSGEGWWWTYPATLMPVHASDVTMTGVPRVLS